jgi:hypothetical protein
MNENNILIIQIQLAAASDANDRTKEELWSQGISCSGCSNISRQINGGVTVVPFDLQPLCAVGAWFNCSSGTAH